MFKHWLAWFADVFARVRNWIEARYQQLSKSKVAAALPLPEQQSKEYRIPPHREGIWVRCSACGRLHNLVAICPVCEQPLCQQTRYCRKHEHDKS